MGKTRNSRDIFVCFIKPSFKILSVFLATSLALGMYFAVLLAPFEAKAGFLDFLGSEASADNTTLGSDNNSQNMGLLQANISSAVVLQDPKGKQLKSTASNGSGKNQITVNTIDTNATIAILSDNAMVPATGPSGVSDGKDEVDPATLETSVYVVRKGDSLSAIADMFDVSVNTILWANNMKKGQKLVEGDVLFILPVSGLEHTVIKGQTLKGIAKIYKADISEIADYNGIDEDAALAIGDKLMIPDAVKSEESDKPVKDLGASIAKDKKYYELHPIQNLNAYFVNPVPGYRKSQGIHDKNAVDLAIAKGTPIHAAAAGRVILARNGYNGGFGNVVIIAHSNGTETLYAHQSKIATHTGDHVEQGQVIGYVGSTGRSTGPHLHFEVHGARNPGADGSWSN